MDELEKALEIKDGSNELHAPAASTDAAPLFSEYYPDWAAFDQAVATAIERHHPIRKRSSLTFEVYNRTVSKGRHDRKPIAEFLSKTFKCTHGIKFRSRGTGKRSRHKQRDIGCPFHIYATALEDAGPLGYRVKVRTHDTHNHVIGPDASKSVGALHEAAEYEYAEVTPAGSDAAATAAAAAAHAHVASPPSDGDLQLHHMSAFAHAAGQLHHHHHHDDHASLHDHANAADILGPSDGNDGESLLAEGVIDSHLADFSTAAEAVAAAAAAVAATLPESAPASTSSSTTAATAVTSRFEATATLEELRRKLSQFADDRDWDQFHSPRNLLLALAGEMGELCECFQWKGDNKPVNEWTTEERVHLGEEISDVMMYLIRLADKCDIDLPTAIYDKMDKNARRFPADAVRGSAKKFNEFKRARLDRETSL